MSPKNIVGQINKIGWKDKVYYIRIETGTGGISIMPLKARYSCGVVIFAPGSVL